MQTRGHQGEMVISWHPDISWLQTANTLVTTNIKAQNVHVQNRFYIRKLSLRWMNPNPQEYSCDCINVNASCVPCVCCSKLNRLFTLETGWSPQRHQPPHRTMVIQTRFSNNWHDVSHLYLLEVKNDESCLNIVPVCDLPPRHQTMFISLVLMSSRSDEESVMGSMQGGARSSQPQVLQYKLSAGTSHPPRLTLITHQSQNCSQCVLLCTIYKRPGTDSVECFKIEQFETQIQLSRARVGLRFVPGLV